MTSVATREVAACSLGAPGPFSTATHTPEGDECHTYRAYSLEV
jgi:hypothetical protein